LSVESYVKPPLGYEQKHVDAKLKELKQHSEKDHKKIEQINIDDSTE
jgi:hypothetical protein